ncbi:Alpha-1,4-glucan-protein synthase family protein, putative [Theobroma cacao]|uniref:Alpha-1,4-glucan-protein synthase family protein, putative n=1 Tax=Theobroma cacao TaxID=3641 RepID=A0A061F7B5_THECC|nr:Alpha-1,4-glucan-protein synthase family protein, putative [Theobroma cacao]
MVKNDGINFKSIHMRTIRRLWLNLADHDAPTQALKPGQRNSRYVDAVITVPAGALAPISGINIAFDREVVGPALVPALRLAGEGKFSWETMKDIWSGMCVKVVCDHLGLGVKTCGELIESVRLPRTATTAEDCVVEVAKAIREQLGSTDPVFARAAGLGQALEISWI